MIETQSSAENITGSTNLVGNFSLSVISAEIDLLLLREEWQELRTRCGNSFSFTMSDLVEAWWHVYSPELTQTFGCVRLNVFTVRDSLGALVAILPCYFVERNVLRGIPSQIVSMGRWPDGRMETMCEEPCDLILEESVEDVHRLIASYLADEFRRLRLDLVHLHETKTKNGPALIASLHKVLGDLRTFSKPISPVVFVELADDWSLHRRGMSRSMRDNLSYYPKLLERNHHTSGVRIVSKLPELERAVAELGRLHRLRSEHQALRRHTIHIPARVQEKYLLDFLGRSSVAEGAFIAELLFDDIVVASQAFLKLGETLVVYYSGFDPAWRKFSPLFLLNSSVFKHAIEMGVKEINFLTVPGDWQRRWGKTREAHSSATVIMNSSLASQLFASLFLLKWKLNSAIRDREARQADLRHERRRALLSKTKPCTKLETATSPAKM